MIIPSDVFSQNQTFDYDNFGLNDKPYFNLYPSQTYVFDYGLVFQETPAGILTREEVYLYTGISVGLNIASTVLTLAPLYYGDSYITSLTVLAQYLLIGAEHVPVYFFDIPKGLIFTGIEAGSFILILLNNTYLQSSTLNELLTQVFHKIGGMYSTYEIYKETRSLTTDSFYPIDWQTYSFGELSYASFVPDNFLKPIVWIPPLAIGGLYALIMPRENAIWRTNRAYIDDIATYPAIGIAVKTLINVVNYSMVAIGEEALYRGVIYEELELNFGKLPAKIIDAIFFPLVHVPQELVAGVPLFNVGFNFVLRGIATILLDIAYDMGGLPLSTALHFWYDFAIATVEYLYKGGAPSDERQKTFTIWMSSYYGGLGISAKYYF
jgi:hypothetical protein